MADTFNLTAAFDKASYNPGDTMTLAVTGTVTSGSATPVSATLTVTAADGTTASLAATSSVTGGAETWTIAADGHSATATA